MKLVKTICLLSIVIIGIFTFLIKFSAVETRFECSGNFISEISANRTATPNQLYIKLHKYRWWVWLWNHESDGAAWFEIPNIALEYVGNVVEVGDQLQFYDFNKKPVGYFSKLSNYLSISKSTWTYDGECIKISE